MYKIKKIIINIIDIINEDDKELNIKETNNIKNPYYNYFNNINNDNLNNNVSSER
jgi:hypothetical protein